MTIHQAPSKKRRQPTPGYRRSLYGKIEIAKKQLGLDEDTYRDMVESLFGAGTRSRKQLTDAQLVNLVEVLKAQGFKPQKKSKAAPARAGNRPLAKGEMARKIRALWLSLYHLGIVCDPSEAALANFVCRMSGVAALQWIDPEAGNKVIEALKAWAARDAGVDWRPYRVLFESIYAPRCRVLEAQWRKLYQLGVAKIESAHALSGYVETILQLGHATHILNLTDEQADEAIRMIGHTIRKAMAKHSEGRR